MTDMDAYPITFSIYAESAEEAERGRQGLIAFINMMRARGAAVRGDKIAEAVSAMAGKGFVINEMVRFLKK